MIGLLCEIVIFFFYINVHDCIFIKPCILVPILKRKKKYIYIYIPVPIYVASEPKGWEK